LTNGVYCFIFSYSFAKSPASLALITSGITDNYLNLFHCTFQGYVLITIEREKFDPGNDHEVLEVRERIRLEKL
jgi:hypothetical protein